MLAISYAYGQEKFKLTGYIADSACIQVNDKPEDAAKCTASYVKDCSLKKNCSIIIDYRIFADGKWYTLNLGSHKLVKSFLTKTSENDHLKVTVTGRMKSMFYLVENVTAAE